MEFPIDEYLVSFLVNRLIKREKPYLIADFLITKFLV